MTSISSLNKRIDRIIAAIDLQNRPRVVDCTGAKEELLAMLESHIASGEDQEEEDDPATHAAWLEQCEALDALLEQSIEDIERIYHVKIVGG